MMSGKYRDSLTDIAQSIQDDVYDIKDDVNSVLTTAGRLKSMLNEDEYDVDNAFDYIDDVVDRLQEIWDKLKKLNDDLD